MSDADKDVLIAIVGPTASGKTGLAVELAERLQGEIINVDSMQVFKGLDVGTAKPTPEERSRAQFHLLDVVSPGEAFDAATFAEQADRAIADIVARGRLPIAAGGTGLYHRALRFGLVESPGRSDEVREALRAERDQKGADAVYEELRQVDPESADRIHPNDWVRVERALEVYRITGRTMSDFQRSHGFSEERYRTLLLGCRRERDDLYQRINQRLQVMWDSGLLDETRRLLDAGLPRSHLPLKALGYRHAADFLEGTVDEAEAFRLAKRDTRHFARRQLSWFRRMDDIHWLDMPLSDAEVAATCVAVEKFLTNSHG